MKKLLVLLFIVNTAMGFSLNNHSFSKGETLVINVSGLVQGNNYAINAFSGVNNVFTHDFVALNDSYVFSYKISDLDPSGEWLLSVNNEEDNISVRLTRDSSMYLVSFITPLSKSYERTESLDISVNLTWGGEVVSNATVESFNDKGQRIFLTEGIPGVYSVSNSLGIDSVIGSRSIVVLASKNNIGGEGVVNITVDRAVINISLIQPELAIYDIGSLINIKLSAFYPNRSEFNEGIRVTYGLKNINVSRVDGFYTGVYSLTPNNNGLGTLLINATDSYGNSGVISKKITGANLTAYYLVSNVYYIIAGVVLLAFIAYFSSRKISSSHNTKNLKEKLKSLIEKKKKLQEEYYEKGTISKKVYDEESGRIDDELRVVNARLNRK